MRLSIYLLSASVLLNASAWAWIALAVPVVDFPVLVSYNIFWQQDILGERPMLFAAPLLGAVILVINVLLIIMLKRVPLSSAFGGATGQAGQAGQNGFLSALLAASTLGLQVVILAVAWLVIKVNT